MGENSRGKANLKRWALSFERKAECSIPTLREPCRYVKPVTVSGANWGAGGPSPPKIPPKFYLLVSLIQCSIYVHAYQALVHFSTYELTSIGGLLA